MIPNKRLCAGAFISALLFSNFAVAADSAPAYITNALKNPLRPPLAISHDPVQKPVEMMRFAGVKPGMNVAEILPHGGYYTRILAGIVGKGGSVYAIVPQGPGGQGTQTRRGPKVKDENQNSEIDRVDLVFTVADQPGYDNVEVYWPAMSAGGGLFPVPKQVDVVFSAYGYHVLHGKEFSTHDFVGVHKAIFRAMKNGGTLVVADNRANPGAGFTVADTLQRVDPEVVKAEILAAGFVFDGESNMFAHANDDKAKPAGDVSATDIFVLRFKKPANAPNTDKRPSMDVMKGLFGNTLRFNAGATGNVTGQRERRIFYHEDMTYQEFGSPGTGNNPFQSGFWYFDADGEACMHQDALADTRGLISCRAGSSLNHKAGDKWMDDRGLPNQVDAGYVYFGD